ncbi:hypothetical protein M3182_14920 [Mesobacillus maritimus]|uniref:hypothetical protein n=1 Tax=Mesobacillus maritimus TaxID=1643336 RepID=UPI00203C5303|nr:hypothetical protein [Mesobacillus maritimus]MCM3587028.1 hypothetical protein [Mesobacillus maritimus]
MNPHQVSVAAESYTATLFAWADFDVSVQYGANQPEYDLVVVCGERMLKVSVKGSNDGGWGLTQSHKRGRTYSEAIDLWVNKHTQNTIVSLVQFKNVDLEKGEAPRVYLATPKEIGEEMKKSRGGHGNTVLRERHIWHNGIAKGHTDEIPEKWKFSRERIEEFFRQK